MKVKKKTLNKKKARTIQSNKGKGPNININIDQSKRSRTVRKSEPQTRPSAPMNTITPVYMPQTQPTILNQAPPPSNPFQQVIQSTQSRSSSSVPNELERPRPKEPDPFDEENHSFVSMGTTGINSVKKVKNEYDAESEEPLSLLEVAERPKERISFQNYGSNTMTIDKMLQIQQGKGPKPFKGKGYNLDVNGSEPIPQEIVRAIREENFRKAPKVENPEFMPKPEEEEPLSRLQQRIKDKKGVLPEPPPKPTINPPRNEPTILSTLISPKKELELEMRSAYEQEIFNMNKEQLKAEAEKVGIGVKGKSIKQVRLELLGVNEDKKDFKLAPASEEVQQINEAETRSKNVHKLNSKKLKELARENDIKIYRTAEEIRAGKKKNLNSTEIANELLQLRYIKGFDPVTPQKTPPPLPERTYPLVVYSPNIGTPNKRLGTDL